MVPHVRTLHPKPRAWALVFLIIPALLACSDSVAPEVELGGEGTWEALGEGLTGAATTFVEWEGDLVVGGLFLTAGDQPARNVARWDGALWHPLGTGLDGPVQALAVYDDELVAAGFFGADRSRVFRWDGSTWQPVGGGLQDGGIMALAVHDGALYAGGQGVARWDGATWTPVEVEVDGQAFAAGRPFAVHRDALVVGVGEDQMARLEGGAWTWIERPAALFGLVSGDGELYGVGGRNVRWTGSGWEELGGTFLQRSHAVHRGVLVIGIDTPGGGAVMHWDGSEWSALQGDMDGRVHGLGSFRRTLLAGGDFSAIDGTPARGIGGVVPDWASGQGGGS